MTEGRKDKCRKKKGQWGNRIKGVKDKKAKGLKEKRSKGQMIVNE